MSLLEIKDLNIHYETDRANIRAVNGVSLSMDEGESLGLVGETGAGKTTTALGILRLVPDPPGKIVSGQILYNGEDILQKSEREMQAIRGDRISMIFQDPMTALDPVMTVGKQIAESLCLHGVSSRRQAETKAGEMLSRVGIDPSRARDYPHQFSGGMKQRVIIAMALACSPRLLIADEPTTALDVTIQAQVMQMMNDLKKQLNTSVILITHDLGLVADFCDRVAIMYAGQIVECGDLEAIFDHASHPYTVGLFNSIPRLDEHMEFLRPIPGAMPDPARLPEGCAFHPRCPYATERCARQSPDAVDINGTGHLVRCWNLSEAREVRV